MNKNLYALLRDSFIPMEDRVFLQLTDGNTWTYRDMDRLCSRFARSFLDMGVSAGDRVVVQVQKSPAAVALYLACLRVGAVYVPLNTAYTPREVEYFLNDAGPALFIGAPERHQQLQPLVRKAGISHYHTLGTNDTGDFWSQVKDLEGYEDIMDAAESDLAAILYTSGTTGRPKGAMLTHGNLSSNAMTLRDFWGFDGTDVLLHALPIYHVHGLFVALHCAMLSACRVIFLPRFDTDQIRAYLPEATVMMGVPTFYTRLLANAGFSASICENIRVFISGSAPLSPQTFTAFEQRTGRKIMERYGMTETGMIASNPLRGERVAGTVGYPLPGIEVRITNDEGKVMPDDEIGNVEVTGPNVFTGYWKRPKLAGEIFRDDGYFITGDLGRLENGRLTLAGRGKDLIISGGLNVYPREIEMCLDALPGVRESAVIGVPHPDYGETVVAVVVVKMGSVLTEKQITEGIRSDLAGFKQPKRVFTVDELPRNAMSKVEKNVLRERYKDVYSNTCI